MSHTFQAFVISDNHDFFATLVLGIDNIDWVELITNYRLGFDSDGVGFKTLICALYYDVWYAQAFLL